jgi:type VI secretion system protein ImpH
MDTKSGHTGTDLANTPQPKRAELLHVLREEPFSMRFFQAVRLLERLYPERMPVGYFVSPHQEVVRFSSRTSLSFPPSELFSYEEPESAPARMQVNFMGLSVIGGPLPHPYAEFLLERMRDKDHAPGEFLDLFNHRFLSLFYRSWKRYRFYIGYELSESQPGESGTADPVTASVYSLLGFGTEGLRGRAAVADEAMLFYAGLLGRRVPTAQVLKQLLADFFELPVEVEEFTGAWNRLSQEDLTFLSEGFRMSESLGVGTVVGDAVWDQQSAVTVKLGPMPLARYQSFLPGGTAAAQLESWLRLLGRGEFDFAVRPVLARDEVPGVPLTSDQGTMGRLGFATWLKIKPFCRDADDALYRLF